MLNKEMQILLNSKVFNGFTEESINKALRCLKAKVKTYNDSSQIFLLGDKANIAPFILEGSIDVSIINNSGNIFIMTRCKEGDLLATAIALSNGENQTMDIRTHGNTKLLMLDLSQLYNRENNTCPYKTMLMQNILSILSNKMIFLQKKFQIITQKSLRDKLLMQLNCLSTSQHSKTIVLPFTREELAQSICAERSAVSRELNRMQCNKIIKLNKNIITLL
jgi:CRP-like cAMP-binding protein